MADAFSWPTPVKQPVECIQRTDPSVLPPAGRPVHRICEHVDFRQPKYLAIGNKHLRTSAHWAATPTGCHAPSVRVQPASSPARSNKPDHFDISDIACTRPCSRPGLTVKRRTDTCGQYGSFVNGQLAVDVSRSTNANCPAVHTNGCHSAYPIAASEPLTKEGHVFERTRHPERPFHKGSRETGTLNVDGISGAAPVLQLRQARKSYDGFDYSDVQQSTSEQCRKHIARQRDFRPDVDVRPLGMWCVQPNHPMQRSQRTVDPLEPVYHIHNQCNRQPLHIGKSIRQVPEHVDPSKRVWKLPATPLAFAKKMEEMKVIKGPRNMFPRKKGMLDLHRPVQVYKRTSSLHIAP